MTKDKHRGCLIMGKGLCAGDQSWLGKLTGLGDKIRMKRCSRMLQTVLMNKRR